MVRYRRNFVPGGTYFFTVTLADRRSTALVDRIESLRAAFSAARNERPFAIEAIVILPEHLHAIFTLPARDADFSGRWRRIKGHFSSALIAAGVATRRSLNGDLTLWQRRFWEHTIRNEGDFARHVDYIHFNPVKHGLVSHVSDWPHSSFHRYVHEGVLPLDWGGDMGEGGGTSANRADDGSDPGCRCAHPGYELHLERDPGAHRPSSQKGADHQGFGRAGDELSQG